MDETEIEKYEYEDHEGISKSDLFLAEHYEELFYMAPKELAVAINAMNEDELIQFNKTIHKGHGMNVCLMIDKLDELYKYLNLNYIFSNVHWRTSIIDEICSLPDHSNLPYEETFHKIFETFKYFTEDENEGKHPNTETKLYEFLYVIYPAFREHFLKLEEADIIKKTENGLKWNRTKISVAEYFDCLECEDRKRRWVFVEKVFGHKNLCQLLNLHKERQCGKPSKDFEEIKKLLGIE
jgi:hypothetical protein